MSTLIGYAFVFLGAGIGGSLRHAVNRAFLPFGSSFPWGTLAVNVTGSIAMGLLAGWFMAATTSVQPRFLTIPAAAQHFRLFLTTGFLGGFTTFSAFSLDFAVLWQRGRSAAAVTYAATSVVLSIVGLLYGLTLTRP